MLHHRGPICFFLLQINANSTIVFADLAGFEDPKGKVDHNETKFINASLYSLKNVFFHLSRIEVVNYKASQLTLFLKPYLQEAKQMLMLYHVKASSLNQGLNHIKDIVTKKKIVKRKALEDIVNRLPSASHLSRAIR